MLFDENEEECEQKGKRRGVVIENNSTKKGKGKSVVKPHKRKSVVRSQTQARSQVAGGLSKRYKQPGMPIRPKLTKQEIKNSSSLKGKKTRKTTVTN